MGTRRASGEALDLTRTLARELALADCVIVSGGAEGIDTAAHEGALDARAATLAVLASGLDRPYPPSNAGLFQRIAERGAVLTENLLEQPPRPHSFLARNRLIAALARLVVVVQAPLKSGALSTAHHARELGRPLMAVPWSPMDLRAQGVLELLARGQATVCRDAADVRRALGDRVPARPARATRGAASTALAPEPQSVLTALRSTPRHVDQLVEATGLSARAVLAALLTLRLEGLAREEPSGWTARRSAP